MKSPKKVTVEVKNLKFCYMQQPDSEFYPVTEKTLTS